MENNITAEEMGSKTWIRHEPWPIDPRAPKIKKSRRGFAVIGFNHAPIFVYEPDKFTRADFHSLCVGLMRNEGIPDYVGDIREMNASEIELEHGIKIDPEMFMRPEESFKITPLPNLGDTELRVSVDAIKKNIHNVHPREQKNRERFNKKGRK